MVNSLVEARAELSRRLRAGDPFRVEELLTGAPTGVLDAESVVDLVYTEFVVRDELGECPDPEELYQRFPAHRGALEELVAAHHEVSEEDSLRAECAMATNAASDTGVYPVKQPRKLGGYRLVEEIGRGGMGVVYRARQKALGRDVALKMILSGDLASADEARRLHQEAAAAAKLVHPNIAQVYEAGEDEGCAYLTMELIDGQTLEVLLAKSPLTWRSAAELLEKVSRAVQHAHDHHVVHRDLKPSNIIVTEEGEPKITDFGLAKNLHEADRSNLTKTGVVLGTPSYMAPELASGAGTQVAPSTDVYSLGGVLYEALTGRPPFVGETALDTLRMVREQHPVSPRQFDDRLPRDIETICLKCLEKQPERRYPSAEALAGDLRRLLEDRPIAAMPPTAGYRLSRFVRRNRGPVLGLAAIATVLLAGVFAATLQASRAAGQKAVADAEAEFAKEINNFLSSVFTSVTPQIAGNDVTMQVALDRAAKAIDANPPAHPRVEAEIRRTIGAAYIGLGLYESAGNQANKALEKAREWYGESHPEVAEILSAIGDVHLQSGRATQAERAFREAIAMYDPRIPEQEQIIGLLYTRLASMLGDAANFEEAERLARKAVAIQQRLQLDKHKEIGSLYTLAGVLYSRRELEEAERVAQAAVQLAAEAFGEESSIFAATLTMVATVNGARKRYSEAVDLYERAILVQEQLMGPRHPELGVALVNLGRDLVQLKRYDEAEARLKRALAIFEVHFGTDHPNTMHALAALGRLYSMTERWDEAEPILRQVLETRSNLLGEDHLETTVSMTNLAGIYRRRGDFAEAAALYQRALDIRRRLLNADHPKVTTAISLVALNKFQDGDLAGAEPLYRDVLQRELAQFGADHPDTRHTINRLAEILEGLGRESEAEKFLAEYEDK